MGKVKLSDDTEDVLRSLAVKGPRLCEIMKDLVERGLINTHSGVAWLTGDGQDYLAAAKEREKRLWELLDEAISGWDKVLGGHGIRNEYAAFLQKRRAVRTELEGE